jgi:hypothetical protein
MPTLIGHRRDMSKTQELISEIDGLKELLALSDQARLYDTKAASKLKAELEVSEARLSELELTCLKQQKELHRQAVTIDKLEHHILRLEEQISERDARHAEDVRAQASLNITHLETELKRASTAPEHYLDSLQEALCKVSSLEILVAQLQQTVDSLREEARQNQSLISQRVSIGPDSSQLMLEDESQGFCQDVEICSVHSFAMETSYDNELTKAVRNHDKISFLDSTDYRLPKISLNSSLCFSDGIPTDRVCEAELRDEVMSLQTQLKSTTDYWINEQKVSQEYIDELRQLLAHFVETRPLEASSTGNQGGHQVRPSIYERLKHWIRN